MTITKSKKDIQRQNFPLISTKFFMPTQQSNLVQRSRLFKLLNKGLERKLTLISAPAGFGKTTLSCSWINKIDIRTGWFSISQEDNDIVHFITYVITALQSIDEKIGRTALALIQTPQPSPIEYVLTNLVNDLTSLSEDIILVLDDYHLIKNKDIHSMIGFLLDHMPTQLHIVIITRADPFLPLARLRSANQMIELRVSDLCFTQDEADTYFSSTMSLSLSSDDIAALVSRTEGWIAGLQMAALSMVNRDDIAGFIKTFAGDNRHITDYLLEEVLHHQPEFIQLFLLKTSILDRLSAPLCNAVTGQDNSQHTLNELERTNMFVIPLDNKRHWYRYHHLFADLLRAHLNQTMPDLAPELHRRASKWYEKENLIADAISHSLAAKDFEQAAQLTEQTFNDRMSRGEDFTTMFQRLAVLPDEIVYNSPTLNVMFAWMLMITLRLDAVEPRLQDVEDKFKDRLPDDLKRQIALIRAELMRYQKDLSNAIKEARHILNAIPENPSITDMQTLTGCVFTLSWAYFGKGELTNAQHQFSEAWKICKATNSITMCLLTLRGQALTLIEQGKLHQAFETLQKGLQLIDQATPQKGQTVPAAVYIHLILGELFLEWNKLDEANQHLEKGIELGVHYQIDGETLRDGYLAKCQLKQAMGDFSSAVDILKLTEQLTLSYQSVPEFNSPVEIYRTRLMLNQAESSDLVEVQQWIESRNLNFHANVESLVEESEYLIWIRLLIVQHEFEQALKLLRYLHQQAENGGRVKTIIKIYILQALAFQAYDKISNAKDSIKKALEIAEPAGFIRLFIIEGQNIVELLEDFIDSKYLNLKDPKDKILYNYIKKLLLEFKLNAHPKKYDGLVDQLSERELDVLRHIEAGLSNLEIAEQLFISLNTVRTHTKNINSKLEVNSRTQALARAKELGLI